VYFTECSYTHFILIPCSRVLLEKLTGSQLVKKFPAFYGTRTFISGFTSALHKAHLIKNIKLQILKDVVFLVGYINNNVDRISRREIKYVSIMRLFDVICKK